MDRESQARIRGAMGLEGENLDTTRWEDASHWIGIYTDLLNFKINLISRVQRETAKLAPIGQKAIAEDLAIIEAQMQRYVERLRLWNKRLWDLHGLLVHGESMTVRHGGRSVDITKREQQLLQYLLDNPHRYMTTG